MQCTEIMAAHFKHIFSVRLAAKYRLFGLSQRHAYMPQKMYLRQIARVGSRDHVGDLRMLKYPGKGYANGFRPEAPLLPARINAKANLGKISVPTTNTYSDVTNQLIGLEMGYGDLKPLIRLK
jgi:hypothetical protein